VIDIAGDWDARHDVVQRFPHRGYVGPEVELALSQHGDQFKFLLLAH
jgi:hypothetical protein